MTKECAFKWDKDPFREHLKKYTVKAFKMLPELDKPSILDLGCGTGVPTMELAKLSNGNITGLDIDQAALDKLSKKIKDAGLTDRIKVVKCSISKLDFPEESFDIIWAEGIIWVVGFEKGLTEWKGFIKPQGYLAVHDEMKDKTKKIEQIKASGYDLLGHFELDRTIWWEDYYKSMEKEIVKLREKYADDPEILKQFQSDQNEIDKYKRDPGQFESAFFIMQKKA